MITYDFEPGFLPGVTPGHLGSYLIPWGPSSAHDEARLNAVLEAHAGVAEVDWDASDDGRTLGLFGTADPIEPCRRFTYTDADLLIIGAELVAQEAADRLSR